MDQRSLIDDLDNRQNDVLNRLTDLNARVESLLNECLVARGKAVRIVDHEPSQLAGLASPSLSVSISEDQRFSE